MLSHDFQMSLNIPISELKEAARWRIERVKSSPYTLMTYLIVNPFPVSATAPHPVFTESAAAFLCTIFSKWNIYKVFLIATSSVQKLIYFPCTLSNLLEKQSDWYAGGRRGRSSQLVQYKNWWVCLSCIERGGEMKSTVNSKHISRILLREVGVHALFISFEVDSSSLSQQEKSHFIRINWQF